jgi:hypothetical protein
MARQAKVQVYTIGYARFGGAGLATMAQIARETDADYQQVSAPADLQRFFGAIWDRITRSYLVRFPVAHGTAKRTRSRYRSMRRPRRSSSPIRDLRADLAVARAGGVGARAPVRRRSCSRGCAARAGSCSSDGPRNGEVHALRRGRLRIGAIDANDIVIPSMAVSRYHARAARVGAQGGDRRSPFGERDPHQRQPRGPRGASRCDRAIGSGSPTSSWCTNDDAVDPNRIEIHSISDNRAPALEQPGHVRRGPRPLGCAAGSWSPTAWADTRAAPRRAACAVETVSSVVGSSSDAPDVALRSALEAANRVVHDESQRNEQLAGMGPRASRRCSRPTGVAFVANVGDSRAYRMRDGAFEQITLDHSLVAELQRRGMITEEEAIVHPRRNEGAALARRRARRRRRHPSARARAGRSRSCCAPTACRGCVRDAEIADGLHREPPAQARAHAGRLREQPRGPDNVHGCRSRGFRGRSRRWLNDPIHSPSARAHARRGRRGGGARGDPGLGTRRRAAPRSRSEAAPAHESPPTVE